MKTAERSLENALAKIEKDHGPGSIFLLSSNENLEVESISTGSRMLNKALGVGGVPKGRIVEIYGPESSGKTTLALHIIAEAQKEGKVCAFVDAEHAIDPQYAEAIGVDAAKLLITQPSNGEEALTIAQDLIESGEVAVVVVDSVAALTPRAELAGEIGDAHIGLQARMMSQAMRKMVGSISNTDTILIFINQIREKIGVMFGSPETTTGGRALKFYSSVRMDIRRIASEKEGEEFSGNRTRVKVVKNKVAPPLRQAEFSIVYGKGIDSIGELLEMAVDADVIEKKGSWFSFDGEKLGQGKVKVSEVLENDQKLLKKISSKLEMIE